MKARLPFIELLSSRNSRYVGLDRLQMRREFFLRVKYFRLHRADWDHLGSGDFVILALIDKAKCQCFPRLWIEKSHPAVEFKA